MYLSARALFIIANAGLLVTAAPAEDHVEEARAARFRPGPRPHPPHPFPIPPPGPTPFPPGHPHPFPPGFGGSLTISQLPVITSISSFEPIIPESCWTTWDDFEHETGGVSVNCFTYTSTTVPGTDICGVCTNAPIPCPLILRLTTTEVPCATDCCPSTPTVYVNGPCPTCGVCNTPTETSIVTTGCPTDEPQTSSFIPCGFRKRCTPAQPEFTPI